MSESSIKRIMTKAYSISAKILGREFNLYRPTDLDDAMSNSNFIRKQYATFTLSKAFTDPQPEGFREFTCFTNHTDLRDGDIFSDGEETFVIAHSRGLEDVVAIRASQIVSVQRASWTTDGGLAAVRQTIARNIPASVVSNASAGVQRISNVDASAQSLRWTVRILANKTDVKATDNITLQDGTLLRVDQITHTELFLLLSATEVTA